MDASKGLLVGWGHGRRRRFPRANDFPTVLMTAPNIGHSRQTHNASTTSGVPRYSVYEHAGMHRGVSSPSPTSAPRDVPPARRKRTTPSRLRRNFHGVQPEPLGRLVPPTVVAVFPAASLVNHSCEPNACFHSRRAGGDGPPLEYILRSTTDIAAGEEVCVSYLAHFANAATEEVGGHYCA